MQMRLQFISKESKQSCLKPNLASNSCRATMQHEVRNQCCRRQVHSCSVVAQWGAFKTRHVWTTSNVLASTLCVPAMTSYSRTSWLDFMNIRGLIYRVRQHGNSTILAVSFDETLHFLELYILYEFIQILTTVTEPPRENNRADII